MGAQERTTFEETPENLAAEEAEFLAAFGNADEEPPAPKEAATEEKEEPEPGTEGQPQEEEQQPAAVPAAEQEPAAAEPTVADLLKVIEEQKNEQARLRDKIYGKFGEITQKIEALKGSASGLSPKAKERLLADFPDLHDLLFVDDEEQAPVVPAAPAAPAAPAVPATTADENDPEKVVEYRLLTRTHNDWQQIVASQEFRTWMNTELSPEDRSALDNSWDADFVSDKLTEFKQYRTAQAKKVEDEQLKQKRLSSAVTPAGRPSRQLSHSEDDEEAAMLAAYRPPR